MKKHPTKYIAAATFCFVVLSLSACGNSDNTSLTPVVSTETFDGSRPSISNLYSESQVDAIEQLGLTFNLGDQPPNIEGSFRVAQSTLQASTVPGEEGSSGAEFSNLNFTFSNQDSTTLTVDLNSTADAGEVTVGTGSFISGNNQLFTVYFVAETTIDGFDADTTFTISGVMGSGGIQNLQFAVFMLDNRGDPGGVFIPENTGRLLIDQDGLSERLQEEKIQYSVPSNVTHKTNLLGYPK